MIKVLNVRNTGPWKLTLEFSDHTHGQFDATPYLAEHHGPLLEALRNPDYFARVFVDAGALCWPNGLELSPTRLRELIKSGVAA